MKLAALLLLCCSCVTPSDLRQLKVAQAQFMEHTKESLYEYRSGLLTYDEYERRAAKLRAGFQDDVERVAAEAETRPRGVFNLVIELLTLGAAVAYTGVRARQSAVRQVMALRDDARRARGEPVEAPS